MSALSQLFHLTELTHDQNPFILPLPVDHQSLLRLHDLSVAAQVPALFPQAWPECGRLLFLLLLDLFVLVVDFLLFLFLQFPLLVQSVECAFLLFLLRNIGKGEAGSVGYFLQSEESRCCLALNPSLRH